MEAGKTYKKERVSILDEKVSGYPEQLHRHASSPLKEPLFDIERVWKLMDGAIDVHIHSGPDAYTTRVADEVELATQACQAGLRAVVFKCHSAPNARSVGVVQKAVDQWAKEHGKRQTEVFGGVVLNFSVGGLNPEAVVVNARLGGKYVWTPNLDSATHRRVMGLSPGIEVIDENGNIVPPLKEIFGLIAEADMVLGLCHITAKELFVLIDEAKKAKVKRIEIIHPNHPSFKLSLDELKMAADKGVYSGLYGFSVAPPMFDLDYYLNAIEVVGVDHIVFGSDCGHFKNIVPIESMRMLITGLLLAGVADEDVEKIVKINAARLLY